MSSEEIINLTKFQNNNRGQQIMSKKVDILEIGIDKLNESECVDRIKQALKGAKNTKIFTFLRMFFRPLILIFKF